MEVLRCKNCGANVKDCGNGKYYCEHCGSTFIEETNRSVSVGGNRGGFLVQGGVLKKYVGEGFGSIVLPSGIVAIGEGAFKDMKHIKSVFVPEGVTEIGDEAFFNCSDLESVNIPDSIKVIGVRAFKCSGIKRVKFPDNLERLGEEAFMECMDLFEITLPERKIKYDKTFKKCRNLVRVNGDLRNIILSFMPNTVLKNSCGQTTLFDAFQATPFYKNMYETVVLKKVCPICGGTLSKQFLSLQYKCKSCGESYCYNQAYIPR